MHTWPLIVYCVTGLVQYVASQALALQVGMPDMYIGWTAVHKFVCALHQQHVQARGTAAGPKSRGLDFFSAAHVPESISDQFGPDRNTECIDIWRLLICPIIPLWGRPIILPLGCIYCTLRFSFFFLREICVWMFKCLCCYIFL